MSTTRIYCCACKTDVAARFTTGAEVYGKRSRYKTVPLYVCDTCKNYVGCHQTDHGRNDIPLGTIPTPELRDARQHIHRVLDPLYKGTRHSRGEIYRRVSEKLGFHYHTATLRTIDEARDAYRAILEVKKELSCDTSQ